MFGIKTSLMRILKDVLLKKFKEDNPELVALSPIIEVDGIFESSNNDYSEIVAYGSPLMEITVKHPFVFDNRLVPQAFQGVKVNNVCIGKFPKEFPEPTTDDVPLEIHFAPDRYIAFVNRKLTLIRKKLKKPNLTKGEALDAISFEGSFEKHVNWCKQLAQER